MTEKARNGYIFSFAIAATSLTAAGFGALGGWPYAAITFGVFFAVITVGLCLPDKT